MQSADADRSAVVLLYHDMDRYGGLQSIVVRIAAQLKGEGRQCIVVCRSSRCVPELREVPVIEIEQGLRSLATALDAMVGQRVPGVDVLAFAPLSGALGYSLARAIKKRRSTLCVRFKLGIFHPRDFFREQERKHVHFLNRHLGRSLGVDSLYFMNKPCRTSHASFLDRDLDRSRIVPVPIDFRAPRWQAVSAGPALRIAAVGRIVPFKAYNFALPGIVAELRRRGIDAECDIFGYGSHEHELRRAIGKSGQERSLRFLGILDFSDFDDVVSQYDIFIGVGTAALQAAQLGMPTLLAIDRDGENCYGFISDSEFGTLGESQAGFARRPVTEVLEEYARSDRAHREALSRACREAVAGYDIRGYTDAVFGEEQVERRLNEVLTDLYCRFYVRLNGEGLLRRSLRAIRTLLEKAPRRAPR